MLLTSLPLPFLPNGTVSDYCGVVVGPKRFCILSMSWAALPASPASFASAPADDARDAGDVTHAGDGKSGNKRMT